jgi:hypothetical protein
MIAIASAGFGLTLLVFYPGVMTVDAQFVYRDIAEEFLGDWQSPVMTVLWKLIDPIAPGAASMFLLTASLYWLAFGLLACIVAQRSALTAASLLVMAALPPAFFLLGMIWRDVLFASLWLLAAALAFSTIGSRTALRLPMQALALGLLALGVLLRPNALLAGPVLAAYIAWPARFCLKRAAICFVPAAIALFAILQFVYYGVLRATPQHVHQAVMVFDLGGISHFTGQNQFPGTWSVADSTLITTGCYTPANWDGYFVHEPCRFVMRQLEREKLFGTPAVVDAWKHAILRHPGAYLRHRAGYMWGFLTGAHLVISPPDTDVPAQLAIAERPAFRVLSAIHDALRPTPLFRAGTWLFACFVVCAFAWRRRDTAEGAFALGVCGSATVYVLTFLPVGPSSEFRYAYWAVLAAKAGAAAMTSAPAVRVPSPVAVAPRA